MRKNIRNQEENVLVSENSQYNMFFKESADECCIFHKQKS